MMAPPITQKQLKSFIEGVPYVQMYIPALIGKKKVPFQLGGG